MMTRSICAALVAAAAAALLLLGALSSAQYVDKCKTRVFEQPKDHFAFKKGEKATFLQRVLFNTEWFRKDGPIFFYFGNEADVELYVEHTGLIWENAPRFGAAVVFAEHRYYGKSRPFPDNSCDMSLLTTEQALADFAVVIETFRSELKASAVIGFGGSYGGMLGTVFKFKYPHLVDGVIAGSAPVLAYQELDPPYDPNGFAQVVTRDAGPKCAEAVKKGLQSIEQVGRTKEGRQRLRKTFRTCNSIDSSDDVVELMEMVTSAWDYMAMGDFPYPSRYVQPEGALLPAYPVKAACRRLLLHQDNVEGLASAADVFYNASTTRKCLFGESVSFEALATRLGNPRSPRRGAVRALRQSSSCSGTWDFQWCTEHNMPFTSGTDKDMFYPPSIFSYDDAVKTCTKQWGVVPNRYWARTTYGGLSGLQRSLRNIVFSNGLLDPWSAGGILSSKGFHSSVVTILIPNGAHHLDLMFSHPQDPVDVRLARAIELASIDKWISEAKQKRRHQPISEESIQVA